MMFSCGGGYLAWSWPAEGTEAALRFALSHLGCLRNQHHYFSFLLSILLSVSSSRPIKDGRGLATQRLRDHLLIPRTFLTTQLYDPSQTGFCWAEKDRRLRAPARWLSPPRRGGGRFPRVFQSSPFPLASLYPPRPPLHPGVARLSSLGRASWGSTEARAARG